MKPPFRYPASRALEVSSIQPFCPVLMETYGMNNRDVALEFVKCFCSGDVKALVPLLAADLQLIGPLYQFNSADAYVDSLENDPPEQCGYRVLSITENEDSVSIYYDYERNEREITIAQLFKFKNQQIIEMRLVFDGRGFD